MAKCLKCFRLSEECLDSETMAQMLEAARARSDVDFDLSGLSGVDVADQLLTLVTCTSDTDTRYVVVAKRTA